jgi:hypothetical protein
MSAAKHWRLGVVTLACAALIAFPPAIAFAGHTGHTHATYASGYYGAGGAHQTTSWNGRSFNRVWHQNGYRWDLWYLKTDGSTSGYWYGTVNPTESPYTASYAKSVCYNYNDNSGTLWTCETNTSA